MVDVVLSVPLNLAYESCDRLNTSPSADLFMGLFESLPDGPLKRSQINKLETMRVVQGVFPVYSDLDPDTAYGIAILLNGTLRAWAHSDEKDEWVELDEKEIDNPEGGLPFDEQETLEEFQSKIAKEVGAISV